jgi:hypothetical protein
MGSCWLAGGTIMSFMCEMDRWGMWVGEPGGGVQSGRRRILLPPSRSPLPLFLSLQLTLNN